MLSSVTQSLRGVSLMPLCAEASSSRLPLCSKRFVRHAAAIHTSAVRREESVRDDGEARPLPQSAFSIPTLQPVDVLPASFRATQKSSESHRTVEPILEEQMAYGARKESHRLHVQSTRNNIIINLTTPGGSCLYRTTSGKVGFKKAARSSYEAAYAAALDMFEKIDQNRVKWHIASMEIIWTKFGKGREAMYRALLSNEGRQVRNLIKRMSDNTPIRIGGCRPKKKRML